MLSAHACGESAMHKHHQSDSLFSQRQRKTHALKVSEAKHFHSHLDTSVLVGFSSKAVPLLRLFIVLRGSNNKHLLLKCINCNKNKNNNKLKQSPSRKRKEGRKKKVKKKNSKKKKTTEINYLRNI